MTWLLLSLIGTVLLGSMILCFKKLSLSGVPPEIMLFWLFSLGALLAGGQLIATRQSPRLGWSAFALMVAATVLSYIGNLLYIKAVGLAPNPGYPAAIEGCKAVLIAIAAVCLFGSEFTIMKGVGVLLCVAGVCLIAR